MARIRSVHPGLLTDEAGAPYFKGGALLARLTELGDY